MHAKFALCLAAVGFATGAWAQSAPPAPPATVAAPPPGVVQLQAVTLSGEQPGPALWEVRRGDHVMWIIGTMAPLPKHAQWQWTDLERVLGRASELLEAPSAPVTAPAGTDIADQIDTYLKTSPALLPTDRAGGVTNGDEPRKVHGEVAFAVGTGGYRSAYVRGDFPVGQSGTLSVAVSESRFKGRFDPVQRQRLGLGLNFTGAAPDGIEPWRRHACLDQQRRSMDPTPGFDISSSLACPGPYPVQAEGDAR